MQYINMEILITEMVVSNEAKNVIPLKFLRKIKKIVFPLVNSIREHTVYHTLCQRQTGTLKSRKTLLTTHKK
jgi:hypothetical protein